MLLAMRAISAAASFAHQFQSLPISQVVELNLGLVEIRRTPGIIIQSSVVRLASASLRLLNGVFHDLLVVVVAA